MRVAAGFGLAALGLELLLAGFKPAIVAPQPFGLWFLASFLAVYALHGALVGDGARAGAPAAG